MAVVKQPNDQAYATAAGGNGWSAERTIEMKSNIERIEEAAVAGAARGSAATDKKKTRIACPACQAQRTSIQPEARNARTVPRVRGAWTERKTCKPPVKTKPAEQVDMTTVKS